MKIGDKLYIIISSAHIKSSSISINEYYTDSFNISEIKEITNNSLRLYPIIGSVNAVYYDKSVDLDKGFNINEYWWNHQYITTNEKLAIEKYKQLLKEHELS